MRSWRYPEMELVDWRSRLVDLRPGLFSDVKPVTGPDGPELRCTGWPAVSDGWGSTVDRTCTRLARAVREDPGEAVVDGIREKWGVLSLDVVGRGLTDAAREAATLAVDFAEARSSRVCTVRGERGCRWSKGGWLDTRCAEHSEGRPLPCKPYVLGTWRGSRAEASARRYVFEADRFIPSPMPEDW